MYRGVDKNVHPKTILQNKIKKKKKKKKEKNLFLRKTNFSRNAGKHTEEKAQNPSQKTIGTN